MEKHNVKKELHPLNDNLRKKLPSLNNVKRSVCVGSRSILEKLSDPDGKLKIIRNRKQ